MLEEQIYTEGNLKFASQNLFVLLIVGKKSMCYCTVFA